MESFIKLEIVSVMELFIMLCFRCGAKVNRKKMTNWNNLGLGHDRLGEEIACCGIGCFLPNC